MHLWPCFSTGTVLTIPVPHARDLTKLLNSEGSWYALFISQADLPLPTLVVELGQTHCLLWMLVACLLPMCGSLSVGLCWLLMAEHQGVQQDGLLEWPSCSLRATPEAVTCSVTGLPNGCLVTLCMSSRGHPCAC